MANYTIDMSKIISSYGERKDWLQTPIEHTIEVARPKIFDFNYFFNAWDNDRVPTEKKKTDEEILAYNNEVKKQLETTILNRYFNYEIAFETYARWKQALQARMIEITPFYNQMLQILSDKYEWRTFIESERIYSSDIADNGNTTNNNISKGQIVNGDFPNASVADGYATTKTESEASDDAETITENHTTENITEKKQGSAGTPPQRLQLESYSAIRNVFQMYTDELKDLFYFTIDFEGGYTV